MHSQHPFDIPHQHASSTYPINAPYQHTPSTHPLNLPHQYTPSTHPLNLPHQHTLSTYPINTPSQLTPSTHPINTPHQHTPSTHPSTHPINSPYQHTLSTQVEHSRGNCEDKLRTLVYHLIGLAGVSILQAHMALSAYQQPPSQLQPQLSKQQKLIKSRLPQPPQPPPLTDHGGSSGVGVGVGLAVGVGAVGEGVFDGFTAVTHLRRALRAYSYAWSFLHKHRQACPLVGLAKVHTYSAPSSPSSPLLTPLPPYPLTFSHLLTFFSFSPSPSPSFLLGHGVS